MKKAFLLLAAMLAVSPAAFAAEDNAGANAVPVQQKSEDTTASAIELRLTGADGKDAGIATITETPHGLLVKVEATGLANGWHGVHFHGTGDCSDHTDHFKKSGGHAMREDEKHGLASDEGPHAGDLPNIFAGADGIARAEFFTANIGLDMLQDKDGGAIMIHAGPDDHRTDPSGGSGDRLACGVIPAAKDE